jgi:delta8-fatty-acid desaturase
VPMVVEEEEEEEEEEEVDQVVVEDKEEDVPDDDDSADIKNLESLDEEDSCASTAFHPGLLLAPAIRRCNSSCSSSSIPESSRPPSIFSAAATTVASDSDSLAPLDDDDSPPISQLDAQTQDEVLAKFAILSDRIEAENLYSASALCYLIDFSRCAALLLLMVYFLRREWYVTSACFMGFFWHQIVATAHDAGHLAVTQRWSLDTILGTVVMNFAGGLSCGWWKRNHNIHHLVPNSLSHDADVQLLPFIALSPRMFDGVYSTVAEAVMAYNPLASFFVTKQAWLYYVLLSLGRFNLYFLAFDYVLGELFGRDAHKLTPMHRRHRILEAVGLVFFWAWYGYFLVYSTLPDTLTRVIFVLVSHVVTLPLHLQLTVSHFSMSTDEGPASETWVERTLRTTMDIDAARWLDWFHGGLQFQVTHHLFPRLPRHSLRRASELTREFCHDVGITYERYDFPECNRRLLGKLDEVAALARLLADCKDEVVRKGEYLHGHWE